MLIRNIQKSNKQKNKLGGFWVEKFRWLSWSERSEWSVITGRCIWKPSKQMCWNIWTGSCSLFVGIRITMYARLKKTRVELELLTDMLLMAEKGIRGGICHSPYRYARENINKYMK